MVTKTLRGWHGNEKSELGADTLGRASSGHPLLILTVHHKRASFAHAQRCTGKHDGARLRRVAAGVGRF